MFNSSATRSSNMFMDNKFHLNSETYLTLHRIRSGKMGLTRQGCPFFPYFRARWVKDFGRHRLMCSGLPDPFFAGFAWYVNKILCIFRSIKCSAHGYTPSRPHFCVGQTKVFPNALNYTRRAPALFFCGILWNMPKRVGMPACYPYVE